jgi:hypothetical protein
MLIFTLRNAPFKANIYILMIRLIIYKKFKYGFKKYIKLLFLKYSQFSLEFFFFGLDELSVNSNLM